MPTYTVTYEMSVEADSAEEAARQAYDNMSDPASWDMPPVLGVKNDETGEEQDIDLVPADSPLGRMLER